MSACSLGLDDFHINFTAFCVFDFTLHTCAQPVIRSRRITHELATHTVSIALRSQPLFPVLFTSIQAEVKRAGKRHWLQETAVSLYGEEL